MGLADAMRAIGPVDAWVSSAMRALLIATVVYGAGGAIVVAFVERALGGRWALLRGVNIRSSLRHASRRAVGLLVGSCVASTAACGLHFACLAAYPEVDWRLRVLATYCVLTVLGISLLAVVRRRRWLEQRAVLSTLASVFLVLFAWSVCSTPRGLVKRIEAVNDRPLSALPSADHPNILFVVLDTTRADHLSLYGYPRETSPFLTELAKTSTVYTHAIAPSPWTIPSHASMFTGQYPITHRTTCEHRVLHQTFTTVAELLEQNGYDTVGLSCNSWVGPKFHLDQGFRQFYEVYRAEQLLRHDPLRRTMVGTVARAVHGRFGLPDKGAAMVGELAVDWLDDWESAPDRRPFFMFINYLEPHLPYRPPSAYAKEFLKAPVRPAVRRLSSDHWLPEAFVRMGLPETLAEEDYRQLASLYDAEIAYMDAQFEALIEDLRQRGLLDETLVLVVGDHGENLGEHGGLLDHCFSLHETVLHVPLLVRYPGVYPSGLRYDRPVSIVSAFSTILRSAQVEPDPAWPPAEAPLPRSSDEPGPPFAVAEYGLPVFELGYLATQVPGANIQRFAVRQRAIQDGTWKVILKSDGSASLFDLRQTPTEGDAKDPHVETEGQRLLAELESWVSGARHPGPDISEDTEALDEETREILRSVGYAW